MHNFNKVILSHQRVIGSAALLVVMMKMDQI